MGYIKKLEEQLKGEVRKLMELAEAADNEALPEGIDLPDEIARREDRLKAIATAKAKDRSPGPGTVHTGTGRLPGQAGSA